MSTVIYLCRHGETHWNREGRVQGQLNSALTPKGEQQAKALGKQLENSGIEHIFASPQGRAMQTARLANSALNQHITEIEGLQERNFGSLQGTIKDKNTFAQRLSEEEVESEAMCAARMHEALVGCLHERRLHERKRCTVMVVSHGEIIRHFIASLGGFEASSVTLKNCQWHKISLHNTSFSTSFSLCSSLNRH